VSLASPSPIPPSLSADPSADGEAKPPPTTRAQAGLAYATVLMAAVGVLEVLVQLVLEVATVTRSTMTVWERVLISAYLTVLSTLPFVVFPVVVAPAVVALLWILPPTRPKTLDAVPDERRQLARWLWWLAVVAVVLVAAVTVDRFRQASVPVSVWMWALLAFTWAYAGALHRALRVQALRAAAGKTRISATSIAVAAALVSPLQLPGVLLPLWVLWTSRGSARRSA
jgi:hypothetical protein